MQTAHVLDGCAQRHSPQRALVPAAAQAMSPTQLQDRAVWFCRWLGPLDVDAVLCVFEQPETWLHSAGKPCC